MYIYLLRKNEKDQKKKKIQNDDNRDSLEGLMSSVSLNIFLYYKFRSRNLLFLLSLISL